MHNYGSQKWNTPPKMRVACVSVLRSYVRSGLRVAWGAFVGQAASLLVHVYLRSQWSSKICFLYIQRNTLGRGRPPYIPPFGPFVLMVECHFFRLN